MSSLFSYGWIGFSKPSQNIHYKICLLICFLLACCRTLLWINTFSALITKISSFFQRLSTIFAKFNVFHFSPPSLNFSEIFIFSYESNCLKSLLIFQISSPPLFLFTSCKICPCSLYHIIIYVHSVQVFFNCMCKKMPQKTLWHLLISIY